MNPSLFAPVGLLRPVLGLLAFGMAVLAAPAHAQDPATAGFGVPDSTLVDRVVAVVGDSVILETELRDAVLEAQVQAQSSTVNPREMLEQLINEQLILQAAARDSTMRIPPEELDARVEQGFQTIRSRFGTQAAFERALADQGLSEEEYRTELRDNLRRQQIQQLFISRQLQDASPVAVTESEMRSFFEERRGSLEEQPERVTLQQVFVPVEASDSAWARARTLADSLYRAVTVDGADFTALATEFSDDPGSARSGGDLGWFRRGAMVREFEGTAFRTPPGAVAPPVRTQFGWHVIQVERSRPGERKAAHILITPEVTEADAERARETAAEVGEAARSGRDMLELYDEYSDTELPEEFEIPRDQLADVPYEGYAENIQGIEEGEVLGPFRVSVQGQDYFVVARAVEVREAGELTFEDLRDDVRDALQRQKQVDRVFQRLRARTYIDVRL
jgi:peptidyl-prolyl cis-trans isomerase SurA